MTTNRRPPCRRLPVVLLALCVGPAAAFGQATGGTADRGQAATAPAKPVIAPEADRILGEMGKYLEQAKHFSFHAEIAHDDLLPTGQKIELGATYDAAVRRPDRVYTEYWGDAGGRRFWYDGAAITLYDPNLNVWASEPAKPTIDATLAYLIEQLGFTPPLSDLMTSDPGGTLRRNVLFGFYVGASRVDGVRCHHLAFVEQAIDWQIWIEDGVQWVPRKLVITYKTIPGAPQFSAVLSAWDLATRPPDALFTPQIPPDAGRISFLKAAATARTPRKGESK